MTTTKEQEEAAHAFLCGISSDVVTADIGPSLAAWLATRERAVEVRTLRRALCAVDALDDFLTCHRVGRPPSEDLWRRIESARRWATESRVIAAYSAGHETKETP